MCPDEIANVNIRASGNELTIHFYVLSNGERHEIALGDLLDLYWVLGQKTALSSMRAEELNELDDYLTNHPLYS